MILQVWVRGWKSTDHRENAFLGMLELKVLVRKLLAVNGLATRSITIGEIATLDHERLDNTVERAALITISLLAGCQSTAQREHFDCLELQRHSPYRKFSAVCGHVSERRRG